MVKILAAHFIFLLSLATLSSQSGMPKAGPTGFEMAGSQRAIVWADYAGSFQLWRVDLGRAPKWTSLPVPAALQTFKANPKNEDDQPQVAVTLRDGVLRLLWIENQDCIRGSTNVECHFTVNQANSEDDGASWETFVSRFSGNPPMSKVDQAVMTDRLHGWMLPISAAGAGLLPEMLATTSDGGQHWKKVQAKDMPIGGNFPQLLIAHSPLEAWFATIHYDKDVNPVTMSHTEDGGRTWKEDTSFKKRFPWCENCTAQNLSAPGESFHPGRVCFEASLGLESVSGEVTETSLALYCLAKNSESWSAPTRVPEAKASFVQAGMEHGATLPLFADSTLGFSVVFAYQQGSDPISDRENVGNSKSDRTWQESAVYQTDDSGKNWHSASASLQAEYRADASLDVTEVAANGKDVLLLLKSTAENTQSKLIYSSDHGFSWIAIQAGGK
jgi:hypothetical protein